MISLNPHGIGTTRRNAPGTAVTAKPTANGGELWAGMIVPDLVLCSSEGIEAGAVRLFPGYPTEVVSSPLHGGRLSNARGSDYLFARSSKKGWRDISSRLTRSPKHSPVSALSTRIGFARNWRGALCKGRGISRGAKLLFKPSKFTLTCRKCHISVTRNRAVMVSRAGPASAKL